jgi:hypothetical protein
MMTFSPQMAFTTTLILCAACVLVCAGVAPAEEVAVDFTKKARIHAPEGSVCDAQPMEEGGVRLSFNFTGSESNWAHFWFPFAGVDNPIQKIVVVAKGSPAQTLFGVAGGPARDRAAWLFGPPNDSGFETFEIDTADGVGKAAGVWETRIVYPVNHVIFIVRADNSGEGFVEISRTVLVTE